MKKLLPLLCVGAGLAAFPLQSKAGHRDYDDNHRDRDGRNRGSHEDRSHGGEVQHRLACLNGSVSRVSNQVRHCDAPDGVRRELEQIRCGVERLNSQVRCGRYEPREVCRQIERFDDDLRCVESSLKARHSRSAFQNGRFPFPLSRLPFLR